MNDLHEEPRTPHTPAKPHLYRSMQSLNYSDID